MTANLQIEFPVAAPSQGTRERVLALFAGKPETLDHGGALSGRPATRIFRGEREVLKIRDELRFPPHDARRWVQHTAEAERLYGVHHPDKTWLLIHRPERTLIASLTPRLVPLHVSLEEKPREQALACLGGVVETILATGARHGKSLDGGLSNFGEDAGGRLFYLDDDIYRWDRFLSLSQYLAHWLRAYPWLSGELASDLGRRCRQSLTRWFPQPITPVTISNQLRDLPLVTAPQRAALQLILAEINTREAKGGVTPAPAVPAAPPPDLKGGGRPLAILADIHANLPALEAVLADIDRNGFADGLVLGDLVGYGPHPEPTMRAVRKRRFGVLLGNHDYGVAHGEFAKGFSTTGRQVAEWTRERLTADDREWLAALPTTLEGEGWIAVHGAPADKSRLLAYVYRMTYEANLDYLEQKGIPLCFHGHTHVEGVWYRAQGQDGFSDDASQALDDYRFALVCPGSVGQPRGRQGSAARYAVLHPAERRIELRRVDYDVQRTMNDMLRFGLPPELARRLEEGI